MLALPYHKGIAFKALAALADRRPLSRIEANPLLVAAHHFRTNRGNGRMPSHFSAAKSSLCRDYSQWKLAGMH